MEELPEEAADRLARVTRLLTTQRTLPAKLETVVALVRETVPGCDSAGIMLLVEGEPTTAAVSDRVALEIDLVQYETGEGPCLAAIADASVIRIDLIERDKRFPRIVPGALALDLNSFLSMPLIWEGRSVGALNLYSRTPDAFDGQTAELARPLAEHAAEVIATSPLYAFSLDMVDGLVETLENQAVISQAEGVLVASEHMTSADAMDRLRHLALSSGESLRTVADWVLAERPTRGELHQSDTERGR